MLPYAKKLHRYDVKKSKEVLAVFKLFRKKNTRGGGKHPPPHQPPIRDKDKDFQLKFHPLSVTLLRLFKTYLLYILKF